MPRPVTTVIDPERCTGCGLCLTVCPSDTLSLVHGKAVVSGPESMQCGHCEAICPTGAIEVTALSAPLTFATFTTEETWLPPGKIEPALLVRLLRSRRSCRTYEARPVARALLEDLAKIGTTAPSGTNSQPWSFTILASREEVIFLGNRIASFYKRLNRLARNPMARLWSRLFGRDALGRYFRQYHQSMEKGLREWEEKGIDRLFHGAPAAIVVGTRPGASCPEEDALLASQNILLGAHALGLGTCLIGFGVEAMQRDQTIARSLGIPDDEPIHAIIAIGHPQERYQRVAGRRPVRLRYFDMKGKG